MRLPLRTPLLVLALAVMAAAPSAARRVAAGTEEAGGGGDRPEVRVAGVCGHGARSSLKLKSRDGVIQAEFEVDQNRNGRLWQVVFVHERRVDWRGRARTSAPSGSFSVERSLADFAGSDQVMARAVGPGGITCQATTTLPG